MADKLLILFAMAIGALAGAYMDMEIAFYLINGV